MGTSIIISQWFIIRQNLLQNSSHIQTITALFIQELVREGGGRDYHRLRVCVRLYFEQAQRSNNFRIQNEITERGAVTEGKGQNSFTKRKTRECFSAKANGSCSKGESCSFPHAPAVRNREPAQEKVGNTEIQKIQRRWWPQMEKCKQTRNTSVCSRSWFIRDGAIARRNASSSIAW